MLTPFRVTSTEIEVESDRALPPGGEVALVYVGSVLRFGGSTILVHRYRLAAAGAGAAAAPVAPVAPAAVPSSVPQGVQPPTQQQQPGVGYATAAPSAQQPGTGYAGPAPLAQGPAAGGGVSAGGGPQPHQPNAPDPHAPLHKPSDVPGPVIKSLIPPPPPPNADGSPAQTGPRPDIGIYLYMLRRPQDEEKDAHPENAVAEAMVLAKDEAGATEVVVTAAICLGGDPDAARAAWAPELKPFVMKVAGANAPANAPHPFGRIIDRAGKDVTRDVVTVYQLSGGNPQPAPKAPPADEDVEIEADPDSDADTDVDTDAGSGDAEGEAATDVVIEESAAGQAPKTETADTSGADATTEKAKKAAAPSKKKAAAAKASE